MAQASVSVSSARVLVLVIIGVAVSFLTATTFAQFRSSAIDSKVSDIVGNAIPSVQHLSAARSYLHQAMHEVEQLDRVPRAQVAALHAKVMGDLADMDASIQSYLSFPFFPSEPAIAGQIAVAETPFRQALDQTCDSAERGDLPGLRTSLSALKDREEALDDALRRDLDFNAVQAQRLGVEISRVRQQSLLIVGFLDLLSIGLAILAAVLAVKVMKDTLRALEIRASELDSFSARVAHDLKGPLSTIMMAVDLGEREIPNERRVELRRQVRRSARMMNEIIDDLLAFARSGARPAQKVCDFAPIIDTIVGALQTQVREKSIELVVEPFERPLLVACDEGTASSAASNLVRNAVKFVHLGTDPVHRVIIRVRNLPDRLHFEVEDNGPGIAESDQEKVFKPYVRVLTGSSEIGPGLGLGLSTVKRLIEVRGGSVGLRSKPGLGSTFWFELPNGRAESGPGLRSA